MDLPSPPYTPPQLLRDLHLLDMLELTGTTHRQGSGWRCPSPR